MKRIFIIECDSFPQEDFEMIHRYIRKRLDEKNSSLTIKSVPYIEGETLIFE